MTDIRVREGNQRDLDEHVQEAEERETLANLFRHLACLQELADLALFVQFFGQDVQGGGRVQGYLSGVIDEDSVGRLLSYDAGTDLKVFQEVEQVLL